MQLSKIHTFKKKSKPTRNMNGNRVTDTENKLTVSTGDGGEGGDKLRAWD